MKHIEIKKVDGDLLQRISENIYNLMNEDLDRTNQLHTNRKLKKTSVLIRMLAENEK